MLFHHEGWSIKIGGVKLQDKLLLHIRNWVAKRKLRRYLFETDLITWNIFLSIDFEPLRIYMSAQSRAFQLWYAKHWTNFCGIGVKIKKLNYGTMIYVHAGIKSHILQLCIYTYVLIL